MTTYFIALLKFLFPQGIPEFLAEYCSGKEQNQGKKIHNPACQGPQSLTGWASYLSLGQLLTELLHLFSEISDDPRIRILVHHSVVDNVLGSICIPQG